MITSFANLWRITLVAALGAALTTASATPQAQAQAALGAFASYAGAWSGGGKIALANGGVERMRCTANYRIEQGGATLTQSLSCASETYKFELKNRIEAAGDEITGAWLETTHNAQGTITGRTSFDRIEGTVAGPGFTALFSLHERANRQQVSIRVAGGEITEISGEFARSR
jgi:hypothetical protein